MAKRGIADIVHQAGHLHHALEWPGQLFQAILFQQPQLFQPAQHLFGDIAPHLLHLQRVGQASAHRRVALEREDLSFLLQAADCRRVDDPSPITFKDPQDVALRLHPRRRTEASTPVYLVAKINLCHSLSRASNTLPLKRMIDYATKPDTSRVNL